MRRPRPAPVTLVTPLLALAMSVSSGAPAGGQTTCAASLPGNCTVGASASLTIGGVVQLSVSSSNTALTPPTAADYSAGFASTTGPTLTVWANTPWSLQLASTSAVWTAVSSVAGITAWASKPASDLQWSDGASGPWQPASTTGATLASGTRTGGTAVPIFYRTRYAWAADAPGSYSLTLLVSITAP